MGWWVISWLFHFYLQLLLLEKFAPGFNGRMKQRRMEVGGKRNGDKIPSQLSDKITEGFQKGGGQVAQVHFQYISVGKEKAYI